MARGVSFKMRIRLKKDLNGETKSDQILWYRWIKRAIDYSGDGNQPGGRKIYIVPESIQVMDENECLEGIHSCSQSATCLNELGSFSCICENGYVDTAALNNNRPGTQCHNPCLNSTGTYESYTMSHH